MKRALAGDVPQPWWMPRRVLTVVSADVDDAAGVGAIWILWRPKSSQFREHVAVLEWFGERWRYVGGGSSSGDGPVDVDVLDVRNGGGALSLTRSLDPPRSLAAAQMINCVKVRLGREVRDVLIGVRRIEVPEQRSLIAVWTSPQMNRGVRPLIVALGGDGAELSRLGPYDSLDTHTWDRLREEM
ncbi:hypothetical protein NMG29_35805 [Streptomyces cocklensis]|nr:hypothetical protein [Actinacidiphila cocklensis]MDD1063477.1 hypothetical protein [Actinacidiphila cocklensis]